MKYNHEDATTTSQHAFETQDVESDASGFLEALSALTDHTLQIGPLSANGIVATLLGVAIAWAIAKSAPRVIYAIFRQKTPKN